MQRRLYNPYLDDPKPNHRGGLVIRILIIAAIVAGVVFGLLLRSVLQPIWSWIIIVAAALPIVLLLAALAVKLQTSIKSKWPRRLAVWTLVFIILLGVTVVYSFCSVYAAYGLSPVAYYTHAASGHRLVVMKGVDVADPDIDLEHPNYIYGVYPMRGRFFCYFTLGGQVSSNTGIDIVEWSDDGSAADVTIFDRDGAEQHLIIDFNADPNIVPDAEADAEATS
ncbi:MAG: hypothetical protein J5998_11420 [Clostridia bacterium]|nr:hypothetical protein [Clostridia bacterium]